MGAGNAGASGSDAGFQNSVETRNKKANDDAAKSGLNADYQGETYSGKSKNNNNNNNGGGDGGKGNNNNSNITQATKTKSPTVETKVEKAADLTAEQILLRNKKRGRASSIMTSSQGVGKTSSNYELGKTSLLGRV